MMAPSEKQGMHAAQPANAAQVASAEHAANVAQPANGAHAAPATADFPQTQPVSRSVSRSHMGVGHRVIACLAAFAMFVGIGAAIVGAFGLADTSYGAVTACVAAGAAIVACAAIAGRGKVEWIGLGVIAAVLLVFGIACHEQVSSGLAVALNAFEAQSGQQTNIYNLPFVTGDAGDIVFAAILVGAILGALCAQLALRGNIVVATVVAAVLTVLIVFGIVPWSWLIALFAVGVVGALMLNVQFVNNATSAKAMILSVAAVAVVATVVGVATYGISHAANLDAAGARQAIANVVNYVRYGGSGWAMPNGELDNLGAKQTSDRKALTVTSSASGTGSYLRGFVGELYSDNTWTSLPSQTITDNEGLFYWLGQDGFSTTSQLATASSATSFDEVEDASVTIVYEGARNTYSYLPYTYSSGATGTLVTNQSYEARDARTTQETIGVATNALEKAYRVQSSVSQAQEQLQSGTWQQSAASTEAAASSSGSDADSGADGEGEASASAYAYLADEEAYRDFAYDNYLGIPSSVNDTLQQLIGDAGNLGTDEAKELVLRVLDENVTYSTAAITRNGDSDFVSYFLTTSKQGYDVHYASAATLMLRYLGIPARYVEGYLISDDAAGTVEVTENDAHAWCEYYLDGAGWVVFETVPDLRESLQYEASPNYRVSDNSNLQGQTSSQQHQAQVQQEQQQQQQNEQEQALADENSARLRFSLWFFAGLLGALVVAVIVRTILRRKKLAAMNAAFEQGNVRSAVTNMFTYGLHLGRHGLGVTFGNAPFTQQGLHAQEGGLCEAQTFVAAACANERALFSDDDLDEGDRQTMLGFLQEVRKNIAEKASMPKRFALKWIRGII